MPLKKKLNKDLTFGDMFDNEELKEKVETEMEKVAMAYERFKEIQLNQQDDIVVFKQAKVALSERLAIFNVMYFNHRLYGLSKALSYEDWLTSHQPFHWLAEFYQIIQGNGGFDVIIGNPPYLEIREINYSLSNYKTYDSGAVHAFCVERSLNLLNFNGNISMIVPLALVCTQRMVIIQNLLEENKATWYSNFAWRPAKLFDAVNRALQFL